MKHRFSLKNSIILAFIIGLIGNIAQIVLLRELFINFTGNEFTIGIIVASWVLIEAAGAGGIALFLKRKQHVLLILLILQSVFSVCFPVSIFLCRSIKPIFGFLPAEIPSLEYIFLFSFIILSIPSFTHGALFTTVVELARAAAIKRIGFVYAAETVGTTAGGLLIVLLLLLNPNPFTVAFILSAINIGTTFYLFFPKLLPFTGVFLIALPFTPDLNRLSLEIQWGYQKIFKWANSIYNNIVLIQRKNEFTIFVSGSIFATFPNPDIEWIENFSHIPLLLHPRPKKVLIIGGGPGGLIAECLKHQTKVDYVEIDPKIISMLSQIPLNALKKELHNPNLSIYFVDGKKFVKKAPSKAYDVVLIGIGLPESLQTVRMFTVEFFSQIKDILSKNGILCVSLPGSYFYYVKELKEINACLYKTLLKIFKYVKVIPGDFNIFVASQAPYKITPETMLSRLKKRKLDTVLFCRDYLLYRLDVKRMNSVENLFKNTSVLINTDLRPSMLFYSLKFWNAMHAPAMERILDWISKPLFKILLGAAILLISAIFVTVPITPVIRTGIPIFTTGFVAMSASLLATFLFQIEGGYIYYWISVLITMFMTGSGLAGYISTKICAEQDLNYKKVFIINDIFVLALVLIFPTMRIIPVNPAVKYTLFCLTAGFVTGFQFPLASKLLLQFKTRSAQTAAILYALDLAGGCLAGFLFGTSALPNFGIFYFCGFLMWMKLLSLGFGKHLISCLCTS